MNKTAMEGQEETRSRRPRATTRSRSRSARRLPGDQQKACKDEADATYEAAKAAADLPGPS